MRKYTFVILAIVGLVSISAGTYVYSTNKNNQVAKTAHETFEIPKLLDRKGALANTAEWEKTKRETEAIRARLKANPNDQEALLQLAYAFLEEARVTGEHPYYYPNALKLLDRVLSIDPSNFLALSAKASALLSQHHFADAKEVAQITINQYPSKPTGYGAMVDACVELGQYDEAVKMADKMVSIRPDLNSYARVSYLRELYGNPDGAIKAMKMAVDAGYPGSEQEAWARYTLGKLYEQRGDLANAETQYLITLEQRPNYAFAISGLGSIEKARKNYAQAISHYEQALELIPEFSFQEALTDLYKLTGKPEKAKESAATVIKMLEQDAASGHYTNRELAYAYLADDNVEQAYENAKKEYERRPENNGANELMAWVLYKKGEYVQAQKYITTAMRMRSKDPVLNCRAGIILCSNGEKKEGTGLIRTALKMNPYLPEELQKIAAAYN
jgi:pentatricopeptide repeat protein